MPTGYGEKRMENQRRPIYWPEHIKTVEDAEEYLSWCKQSYATAERFFRTSESDSAAVYGPYELDLKKKAIQKAQEILNSMNGATGETKELALEKIVRSEIKKLIKETTGVYASDDDENAPYDPWDPNNAKRREQRAATPTKTKSPLSPQPGDPNRISFVRKELERLPRDIQKATATAHRLGGIGHGIIVSLENYEKLLRAELKASEGTNL
jgi:hypothetical protein